MGMWELTADKALHVYYPDRALVDPPLTGTERRERWRDACDGHLADLEKYHPQGIAAKSRRTKAALWTRK
jgi:hypothetical protein